MSLSRVHSYNYMNVNDGVVRSWRALHLTQKCALIIYSIYLSINVFATLSIHRPSAITSSVLARPIRFFLFALVFVHPSHDQYTKLHTYIK